VTAAIPTTVQTLPTTEAAALVVCVAGCQVLFPDAPQEPLLVPFVLTVLLEGHAPPAAQDGEALPPPTDVVHDGAGAPPAGLVGTPPATDDQLPPAGADQVPLPPAGLVGTPPATDDQLPPTGADQVPLPPAGLDEADSPPAGDDQLPPDGTDDQVPLPPAGVDEVDSPPAGDDQLPPADEPQVGLADSEPVGHQVAEETGLGETTTTEVETTTEDHVSEPDHHVTELLELVVEEGSLVHVGLTGKETDGVLRDQLPDQDFE